MIYGITDWNDNREDLVVWLQDWVDMEGLGEFTEDYDFDLQDHGNGYYEIETENASWVHDMFKQLAREYGVEVDWLT